MSKELTERFNDLATEVIRKAENIRIKGETLEAKPDGRASKELYYDLASLKSDVTDLQRTYLEWFRVSRD